MSDASNNRVRKISTSGIISTIAGNGTGAFAGDGESATLAEIYEPQGLCIDQAGNLLISDCLNYRVRKVDTSGIISTIAGTGVSGFSYDNIPATNSNITPTSICIDPDGNLIVADEGNMRIRKINIDGIITTIAGSGSAVYSGDGGLADSAGIYEPNGVTIDGTRNIYIAEPLNNVVRKIIASPYRISDSFQVFIDNTCGLQITLVASHYSAGQHFTTFFPDGTSMDIPTTASGEQGFTNIFPFYSFSGVTTFKHVLYDGAAAIDSISYSVNYISCQTLTTHLYYDVNDSCKYNPTLPANFVPFVVEIDSNDIPIDTQSVISGLYYNARGNAGDIYTFKIQSFDPRLAFTCPYDGIVRDTLFSGLMSEKNIGFICSDSSSGYDLSVNQSSISGRHVQSTILQVNASTCLDVNTILNLTYSPKYTSLISCYPPPTVITGNNIEWNLGYLDNYVDKEISLTVGILGGPSGWLIPGDTVTMNCVVTPMVGDSDTLNNVIIVTDTVKGSWDPNEMAVWPGNFIADTTLLKYTIQFENTGNDTAHNIAVMDTLSDYLNPSSLRMVSASSNMNISKIYDSVYHWIYRFEFPNINLLDSSHHNLCDGMLIYTIKPRDGLTGGTQIPNHAGIFFDDNAVVMTDTTVSIIGTPTTVTAVSQPPKAFIFPNPVSDVLNIQATGYSTILITDVTSQPILRQNLSGSNTKLNVGNLPAGVYFVNFYSNTGNVVQKFIKI